MTAMEWETRLKAVVRAAQNGDQEPLRITCEQIAAMDELVNPVPVPPPVSEAVVQEVAIRDLNMDMITEE